MPFMEKNGDLFADTDLDAIAHGVNIKGVMGGIAGTIASKYPEMHDYYRYVCRNNLLNGGDILPWKETNKPSVYNLATQINGGADARYPLIKKSVKKMLKHAEANGIDTIGIPEIGCGIGGLELPKVTKIISKLANKSPVTVTMYHYVPPKPKFNPKKTLDDLYKPGKDEDDWFTKAWGPEDWADWPEDDHYSF